MAGNINKLQAPTLDRFGRFAAGASYCQSGREDNPNFWVAQLHYAIGDLDAADRQIRDLLQKDYDRVWEGVKYWEDEPFVQANRIYFQFFAKVLEETGRDPDILPALRRFLQAGA